jgi:hypothetical protein
MRHPQGVIAMDMSSKDSAEVSQLIERCLDQLEERGLQREPKWLDTKQCAARIGVNPITLIRWRKMNPPKGPRAYVAHDSRITRYKTIQVDAWLSARTPKSEQDDA